MATPLNILIVEDSQDDAELVARELRRAGFEPRWKRVETEPAFLAELKNSPDIILSDYSMPEFSGLRAAELLQKSGLDIPFILISGTVGEDVAVEAMKHGAADYLLKDRIARLGQAVERALEQKRLRDQRKRAEEELKQSEHRFREMLGNLKLIAMTLDKQGKVTFCNDYLLQLTGHTREEIIGADWFEKFIPETEVAIKKIFLDTIETGAVPTHLQNSIKTASGERRDILWNNTMLRDGSGNIIGSASIGEDVTERKRAEEELLWKTAFLEAQVDSSLDGILVVDDQRRQILQNQRLNDLWKIPPHIAGNKDDAVQVQFVANKTKNPQQFVDKVVYLYSHPDEVSRDEIELIDGTILDRYSSRVRDKAGKYYGRIWTFRDITERRQLEAQFRQSQKMEAFGQLAGGVAHDFNNMLAVILMQAELLKTDEHLTSGHLETATGIINAAQRAANLTRQLLMFSRKETLQLRDLDLGQSIKELAKMLQRTLGEDINIKIISAAQPLFIRADATMMDQVLMNLSVNARDAMPKGGELVFEISAIGFDEITAAQHPLARPGSFVCLSVSDTGSGIPPEVLPRIFEPFFTTKEAGKGTGLGLATVFGIIQQHQGWISVYSEAGHGTTFRIYLPRLTTLSGQPSGQPELASRRGGDETILLVEDEPLVRNSLRLSLAQLGYRVLEASNGTEALERAKQHPAEIHLLLTDLVMPGGMTGTDLAARLVRDNSSLKVIYTSGYSSGIITGKLSLQEGVNFLNKPFDAHKLAQTVRSCLDNT
jgi:two-component system, cell cycle sensor histidine kinase and response regulator CckA